MRKWQNIALVEQYLTILRNICYNKATHKQEIDLTKRKKIRVVNFDNIFTNIFKKNCVFTPVLFPLASSLIQMVEKIYCYSISIMSNDVNLSRQFTNPKNQRNLPVQNNYFQQHYTDLMHCSHLPIQSINLSQSDHFQ